MLEYVQNLTKTEHGYGVDLSQFTCLKTLSQENSCGVEKNQDLSAHSPIESMDPN